jgi:hypothetical protein
LLTAHVVYASSGRVALVQPAVADATIAEALHRIEGELVAEGFEVVLASSPPPIDRPATGRADSSSPSEPSSPSAAVSPGVLASIDLTLNEGAHIVELRVVDRATDKVVIRRVPVEPAETSHAAEILAVRAVELLRASLLELLVAKHPMPAGSSPSGASDLPDLNRAARWAAQTLVPEQEPMWGVEAGAAILGDFGGIPPSAVALVRVRRKLVGPLGLRLTAAPLGTSPRVGSTAENSAGTAFVTQDLGLVEMVLEVTTKSFVHPLFSAGAGVLYEKIDGRANVNFPYLSERPSQWAAAFDAGVGADLRLARHLSLAFETHAFVATPYPVVVFLGSEVAHAGTPSLLASLSVVGWL